MKGSRSEGLDAVVDLVMNRDCPPANGALIVGRAHGHRCKAQVQGCQQGLLLHLDRMPNPAGSRSYSLVENSSALRGGQCFWSENVERVAVAVALSSFVIEATPAQAGQSQRLVRLVRFLTPRATCLALDIHGKLMLAVLIGLHRLASQRCLLLPVFLSVVSVTLYYYDYLCGWVYILLSESTNLSLTPRSDVGWLLVFWKRETSAGVTAWLCVQKAALRVRLLHMLKSLRWPTVHDEPR